MKMERHEHLEELRRPDEKLDPTSQLVLDISHIILDQYNYWEKHRCFEAMGACANILHQLFKLGLPLTTTRRSDEQQQPLGSGQDKDNSQ